MISLKQRNTKQILSKMVLSEYIKMKELEQKKELKKLKNDMTDYKRLVADACCVSYSTAWRWCKGLTPVPPLARKVISDLFHMPEQDLFPVADQEP